jgi:small subunit ribosomal protein S18
MAEHKGGRPISGSSRPTGGDKAIAGKKQYFRRKKLCRFCVDKIDDINYKDVRPAQLLYHDAARSLRGGFRRRSASAAAGGTVKRARNIALVPVASL